MQTGDGNEAQWSYKILSESAEHFYKCLTEVLLKFLTGTGSDCGEVVKPLVLQGLKQTWDLLN